MYRYDEFDQKLVDERVAQFRGQVARRLSGELTEDQFKPLRLMNGLYLQLHAYMLRIAIPYGTLSSRQLRMLAQIARKYDKGYGHFTTRQNLQYNWPKLADVPDILADLATVEMHCIQTSGNCIRNVTSDHFAGASADEVDDPRVWSEIIRQWSTFHPEFSFLPRKFKIAVTAAPKDRAAIKVHDIGIVIRRDASATLAFDVYVGGGQGRTPFIGHCIGEGIAAARSARLSRSRRCASTISTAGATTSTRRASRSWCIRSAPTRCAARSPPSSPRSNRTARSPCRKPKIDRIQPISRRRRSRRSATKPRCSQRRRQQSKAFAAWHDINVAPHKVPGYAIVTISLKPIGGVPGDASAEQMERRRRSRRAPSLRRDPRQPRTEPGSRPRAPARPLRRCGRRSTQAGLGTANHGLISDIIACPGLDYCDLANARSINVAQAVSKRFADLDRQRDIGELKIKISGCINACGHHHVGHIGVLGVDKKGVEYYQITLGGSGDETASIGDIIGPAFAENEVADAVETLVDTYLGLRTTGERFLDTYRRIGIQPFREKLYVAH